MVNTWNKAGYGYCLFSITYPLFKCYSNTLFISLKAKLRWWLIQPYLNSNIKSVLLDKVKPQNSANNIAKYSMIMSLNSLIKMHKNSIPKLGSVSPEKYVPTSMVSHIAHIKISVLIFWQEWLFNPSMHLQILRRRKKSLWYVKMGK